MAKIHKTALIEEGAKLADDVEVGAYCVIGPHVEIGAGTVLHSHVVIEGHTIIGQNNQIFSFASLGKAPQDLKYKGEPSRLIIGDNNLIREYVTMNPGTKDDNMETRVGSNCLFMISSHVAHDCVVGNNVILANNATLAGHVKVEDFVIVGGLSAVRQFVRIGKHAMIGGMSGVEQDVVPFSLIVGERAKLTGLNLIGLERRGFDKDHIKALRKAYKDIFVAEEQTLSERLDKASNDFADIDLVKEIVDFARVKSKVGLCQTK